MIQELKKSHIPYEEQIIEVRHLIQSLELNSFMKFMNPILTIFSIILAIIAVQISIFKLNIESLTYSIGIAIIFIFIVYGIYFFTYFKHNGLLVYARFKLSCLEKISKK